MWEVFGIIAAAIIIVILLQVLDVTDALSDRLRGKISRKDLQQKVSDLEKRVDALEKKVQ